MCIGASVAGDRQHGAEGLEFGGGGVGRLVVDVGDDNLGPLGEKLARDGVAAPARAPRDDPDTFLDQAGAALVSTPTAAHSLLQLNP